MFTFDTPVGSSPQCGRVLFNDFHVESEQADYGLGGYTFPAECPAGTMTPAEALFEYSLFDLTGFTGPTTATVAVTRSDRRICRPHPGRESGRHPGGTAR